MTTRPNRQLCPICGIDDDVDLALVDDEWVMTCQNTEHPRYEWRPKSQQAGPGTYRSGLGEELGVYDDLLVCLSDGFCEYGIIEHRYAQRRPDVYKELVARYGHRSIAPSKYTVSSFLGGALGQLWREGSIQGTWGPATGYWSYLSQVGAYASAADADEAVIESWASFCAVHSLGDANDWPALGYRSHDS